MTVIWLSLAFLAVGAFAAVVAARAGRMGGSLVGLLLLALLAWPAMGVDQKIAVDPPRDTDGKTLADLAGIWIYWAPQRLAWTDDGKGNVVWGPVVSVGPTNRVWMPAGVWTSTVSVVAGPYAVWAIAVAAYGAESEPAAANFRIGSVPAVKTKKVP